MSTALDEAYRQTGLAQTAVQAGKQVPEADSCWTKHDSSTRAAHRQLFPEQWPHRLKLHSLTMHLDVRSTQECPDPSTAIKVLPAVKLATHKTRPSFRGNPTCT